MRKKSGEASAHALYLGYRNGAKKRGLEYRVSEKEFKRLCQQPCFYCGELPSRAFKGNNHFGSFLHNGIDRIDNNLGYVKGNMTTACWTCNRAKRNFSVKDFYSYVKRIHETKR